MKAIKIRTVLLASLLLISSFSWIIYVIVHLIETKSWQMDTQEPSRTGIWLAVAAGALSVAAVFGYGLHRWMIKPLEAMSKAARNIAEGDLDIVIPSSGIREIAEVRSGFNTMLEGLRRSASQQSALEEERQFFISAIAHDLRTPLFSLKGYLEGVEHHIAATPEQIDHYVKVCIQKSNQVERLVADLIAYAKTEFMEQLHLEDPIALTDIVQKSVETIHHSAESKLISIRFETPQAKSEFGFIKGDAYLLERAFNNLLDNAVRHTPRNGEISVECILSSDNATVTIRDSGPGIPQADLVHVFEPLYRGESSRNRESGGTGLGLTIAQRIFRSHEGELTVDNHPQGGAMVMVRIPSINVEKLDPADK